MCNGKGFTWLMDQFGGTLSRVLLVAPDRSGPAVEKYNIVGLDKKEKCGAYKEKRRLKSRNSSADGEQVAKVVEEDETGCLTLATNSRYYLA